MKPRTADSEYTAVKRGRKEEQERTGGRMGMLKASRGFYFKYNLCSPYNVTCMSATVFYFLATSPCCLSFFRQKKKWLFLSERERKGWSPHYSVISTETEVEG